jgi:hypothetical protein
VQIVERTKRARQVIVDEPQRAAQALEADLDEDARRVLDVVLRGLEKPRHLPQLGHDAPGALRDGRIVEQRLACQARRQDVGVLLRVALPGADGLQLEETGTDVRFEGRTLEPFGVRQPRGIDRGEPSGESPEIPNLRIDGLPAEVLQHVVMQVHAVEGSVGRVDFVEIREVFVDEVRKGFG